MWLVLIRVIIALVATLVSFYLIFTPHGRSNLTWFLRNFIGAVMDATTPLVTGLSGTLDDIVKVFITAGNATGPSLIETMEKPLADVAAAGFQHVTQNVTGRGHIDPAHWQQTASAAIADAAGFGLASFGVTAAFESLFPERLNTLNGVGPMLATLAGFEEVTRAALGPLFEGAIGTPAKYDTNQRMRPNLPPERAVEILYARNIIGHAEALTLLRYAGFQDAHAEQLLAASYRPVSPFVLSRFADGPDWDPVRMRELLLYAGYRPRDIDLMITAFEAQALRPLRQELLTSIMSSYEQGFSSDQNLQDVINRLGFNQDAQDLIKQIAGLKKSDKVFKGFVTAKVERAKNGVIPVETMRIELGQLGLALEDIDALDDEVRAHNEATDAAAQRREVETLLRHERQLYIQDWILAYQQGDVDAVEFTAGLLAIGLPVVIVGEYLALAQLRKKPPKPPPKKKTPP